MTLPNDEAGSVEAESPEETPVGQLVRQPHGGALRRGSPKGGNPGSGRPASDLRRQMRGSLEKRIKIAERAADDTKAPWRDRIRALEFLAKYGLGQLHEVSVEQVKERVAATLTVIFEEAPPEVAERIKNRLRMVWR